MSATKPPEAPLLTHEQSLSSKVGADSEARQLVDEQEQQVGLQLLLNLTVLLRTARSHGVENRALERPLDAIRAAVTSLGHARPVELRTHASFAYLWDRHLRATNVQQPVVTTFIDVLGRLGLGGVVLEEGVTPEDLKRFAAACDESNLGDAPFDTLSARLAASGARHVGLLAPRAHDVSSAVDEATSGRGRTPAPPAADAARTGAHVPGTTAPPPGRPATRQASLRERARDAYARAAAAVDHLDALARASGTLAFRQARRAIQNLVDAVRNDEATVLGLTSLRAHDEYTHNHSVNVAVLSVALGNRAGYPKHELAELGLAALFHDVGKCAIPLHVLNKEDALEPDDWQLLRTHPSEGLLALLRLRGLDGVPARMAAAAFEHHLTLDGLGYPSLGPTWKPTVASRIVTIADCYDAMTSARVYRREPSAPAEALAYIRDRAGRLFDPTLVKYFVTSVGIIPIGSLVTLGDGRLAVVTRTPSDREKALTPTVRIVSDASGVPVADPPEIDLADPEVLGVTGGIARLVDNARWHLDTSRWLT